jgi:hypothetical protein
MATTAYGPRAVGGDEIKLGPEPGYYNPDERSYEEDAQHEAAEEGNFHRRPMMPPDYIDPETGCTAAEMKEEENGWACPIESKIQGVRTRRPLGEVAVCPIGKVA